MNPVWSRLESASELAKIRYLKNITPYAPWMWSSSPAALALKRLSRRGTCEQITGSSTIVWLATWIGLYHARSIRFGLKFGLSSFQISFMVTISAIVSSSWVFSSLIRAKQASKRHLSPRKRLSMCQSGSRDSWAVWYLSSFSGLVQSTFSFWLGKIAWRTVQATCIIFSPYPWLWSFCKSSCQRLDRSRTEKSLKARRVPLLAKAKKLHNLSQRLQSWPNEHQNIWMTQTYRSIRSIMEH